MKHKQPKPPTLQEQTTKAQRLAEDIKKLTKTEWFTVYDVVNNSNAGHDEIKSHLSTLGFYGFLEIRHIENKSQFKIILDQKERTDIIQTEIDGANKRLNHVKAEKKFFEDLKKTKISLKIV